MKLLPNTFTFKTNLYICTRETKNTVLKLYKITFLWLYLLLTSSSIAFGKEEVNHIQHLQSLLDREVAYDSIASPFTVIKWVNESLPIVRYQQNSELYFKLQYLLARCYMISGNMGLAVECTQNMYEAAHNMHSNYGDALSKMSLGEIYYHSYKLNDAIDSYKAAWEAFGSLPRNKAFRIRVLTGICSMYLRMNRLDDAQPHIKELERYLEQNPTSPYAFNAIREIANYYVSLSARNPKYIDEAYNYIHRMIAINKQRYEPSMDFTIKYITASYYCARGQINPEYFQKAEGNYKELLLSIGQSMEFALYRRLVLLGMIHLYKEQDRYSDACELYRNLFTLTDSISAHAYFNQSEALFAQYDLNSLNGEDVELRRQRNRILYKITGVVVLVFSLTVMSLFYYHKQRIKLMHSIEELKEAQDKANASLKAKSTFLSNTSHEIRTPLNALSGFSELLSLSDIDNETRIQCNDIILQNSSLLLNLIDDVVNFSNLDINRLNFNFERHDAIALCYNVIDTVNKVKQTEAEMRFENNIPQAIIETDASRLQQVLLNLLVNAAKFTPHGSIILKVEQILEQQETLLFSVTDTGCGIPLEKQADIFKRFEKLDETSQGSGLGLSICQIIIEHIGGKIWIDSTYTGGSRFCFTHPFTQTNRRKEGQQP